MWMDPLDPPIMVKGLMKEALAQGDVHIMVDSTSGSKMIMLRRVLYVPELAKVGGGIKRLFSQRGISSMLDNPEPVFTYTKSSVITFGEYEVELDHEHHRGLYTLHKTVITEPPRMRRNNYWIPHREQGGEFEIEDQQAFVALPTELWHRRTGQ